MQGAAADVRISAGDLKQSCGKLCPCRQLKTVLARWSRLRLPLLTYPAATGGAS
jgi:hypothetical protein